MAIVIKKTLTQSGADALVSVPIDTNLTIDGKAGWEIIGARVLFNTLHAVSGSTINATKVVLGTESTIPLPSDNEEIFTLQMGIHGVAGSTSSWVINSTQTLVLPAPRVTVQPTLFLYLSSSATGVANVAYVEVHYDIIKLTDMEVMRLYQGGA